MKKTLHFKIILSSFLLLGFCARAQWGLTGNANTNPANNFIGTTDNADVIFKRNGVRAGLLNSSGGNTSYGVGAINPASTGVSNTAIGHNSLYYNTSGNYNTANGFASIVSNTIGNSNTANGSFALNNNTTGNNNTAIGSYTGLGISTGSANTILGANVTGLPAALSNTVILADGDGNRRLYINNLGNAGIATTNPLEKLEINGAIKLGNTVTTNAGTLRWTGNDFEGYTGTAWKSFTGFSNGQWSKKDNTIYYTQGKVGVGLDTPASALQIYSEEPDVITQIHTVQSFPFTLANPPNNNPVYATQKYGVKALGENDKTAATPQAQGSFQDLFPVVSNAYLQINNKETGKESSHGLAIGLTGTEGSIRLKEKATLSISNYGNIAAIKLRKDSSLAFVTANKTRLTIDETGNVGIGVLPSPSYALSVCGILRAKGVRINLKGCDFVFEENYPLLSLPELEQYIKQNKHLPEIAPAKEMETIDGAEIGEMQSKLLQKMEELTLYILQQQKMIENLQDEVNTLKKK